MIDTLKTAYLPSPCSQCPMILCWPSGLWCKVTANRASGCALSLPIIQSQGTGSVTAERMEGEAIVLTTVINKSVNLYPNTHTHTVPFLRVTAAAEGAGVKWQKGFNSIHQTSNAACRHLYHLPFNMNKWRVKKLLLKIRVASSITHKTGLLLVSLTLQSIHLNVMKAS